MIENFNFAVNYSYIGRRKALIHVYKWNIQNRSCQIYNFLYSMDIQVNLIHLFTTELCSFSLLNLASTLNHALWRCHKYGQTGTIYIKLRIKNLFRDERVDIQFMNWSVSLKVYVITLICREDQLNGVNERWVNGFFSAEVQELFSAFQHHLIWCVIGWKSTAKRIGYACCKDSFLDSLNILNCYERNSKLRSNNWSIIRQLLSNIAKYQINIISDEFPSHDSIWITDISSLSP